MDTNLTFTFRTQLCPYTAGWEFRQAKLSVLVPLFSFNFSNLSFLRLNTFCMLDNCWTLYSVTQEYRFHELSKIERLIDINERSEKAHFSGVSTQLVGFKVSTTDIHVRYHTSTLTL